MRTKHLFHWGGVGLLLAVAACGPGDRAATPSTVTPTTSHPTTPPPITPPPTASESLLEPWIVFQAAQGLRQVLPSGLQARPVVSQFTTHALHPDFSPDGRSLAFNVDDPDGTRDLWVGGWDGADPVRLVDCIVPCRDADSPAWSPDGTRIAFVRVDNVNGHNPGSSLQVVDVKSGDITTMYSTTGVDYLVGARWSPDGRSMVAGVDRYIDDGNDTQEITGRAVVVIHMDASPATMDVIRPFEDFASYPDWHPTKDLILFEMGGERPLDTTDPPQNVFTMRPDGSEVTQVTKQGPNDDGFWMATFRTDGEGILATRVARPSRDLSIVSITMDGTVTDLGTGSRVEGAHPRQRRPPT
jgi:Tol biopolymer transport system component